MINFFRKIRKQFADNNKPIKYFRYAIGEIVLVVIGILIALSINNWNEFRKERAIEKELIVELHTTVKGNHESLLSGLERWQSTTEALELIMYIIDQQLPYADSLSRYFEAAHKKRGGNLNRLNFSGYKSLENRGYNLIRNRELREKVINLFEQRLSGLAATNNQLDIDNSSFHYEYIAKNFTLNDNREIPHDFEYIQNDPFYYSILQSLRGILGRKINRVNFFLKENQQVIQLLETEINKK